jgi:polysaccharide biosynthesis/export protein
MTVLSVLAVAQPPTTSSKDDPAGALKIAAGDLVGVSVFDIPELTQELRVGSDGKIRLALIGDTAVAGLSTQEASQRIADRLRERHFVLQPQVNVLIKEFSTQGVSVVGEVQHPGVFRVLGPHTLLDIVALAGGLTKLADTAITVERRSNGHQKITARLKSDDAESALASDVEVFPGDLVLVPRAGVVYVLGDVARPGGYVMESNGAMTLLQALAQAGGPSATAAPNKSVWLRKKGESYATDRLDLTKISRGEAHDVKLQANDVIFVPNSRIKRTVASFAGILGSLGSATIYAGVH